MKIDNGIRIMTAGSDTYTAETFGDELVLFISDAGGLLTMVAEDGIVVLPDAATIGRLAAREASR